MNLFKDNYKCMLLIDFMRETEQITIEYSFMRFAFKVRFEVIMNIRYYYGNENKVCQRIE